MKIYVLITFGFIFFTGCRDYKREFPVNVTFDIETLVRKGNFGDNWCSKCEYPASVGFWYAENPWGPWTQFHYVEKFYADREENRTYGFKLSPKWISEDGKKMILIWSDAGDNHSTNYKWNQMEIEIITDKGKVS